MGRVTDHRTSPPERLGPCGSVTVVTGRRQVVFNPRRQLPRTFAGPRNYHARTVSYGQVSGSSVTSVRDSAAGGMASRRLRAPPSPVNLFDPRRRRVLAVLYTMLEFCVVEFESVGGEPAASASIRFGRRLALWLFRLSDVYWL
jgi:hypothetical protein